MDDGLLRLRDYASDTVARANPRPLAVPRLYTRDRAGRVGGLGSRRSSDSKRASGSPDGRIFLALIALDLALFAIFRLTGAGDLIPRVASPGSNAARVEALIHRSICGQSSRRTL